MFIYKYLRSIRTRNGSVHHPSSFHASFYKKQSGVSFIDIIIGSALLLIFFLGIFGAFKLSLALNAATRARTGALSLANERLEYIRSLPYDAIGTEGGIPAGSLTQHETIILNSITYDRRTLILYADDPADGSGAADHNTLTTDYKIVKVELSWQERKGVPRSYAIVARIVPKGIETTAGGGTLAIHVTDALSAALQGASVHIVNDTISPNIDLTIQTGEEGEVFLPGAPAGSNYRITVFKSGYSTAGTYETSAENPSPSPSPISVATSSTSVATFAIDRLGTIILTSVKPPLPATTTETFDDPGHLVQSDSTTLENEMLVLAGLPGSYATSGSATISPTAPARLIAWDRFSLSAAVPNGTYVTYQFVTDEDGTPISDTDLPGNTAGFTASSVDLSVLATSTYPAIGVMFRLLSDGSATPFIEDYSLSYTTGPEPLPNISFSVHGDKYIGTSPGGPVYKTAFNTTTDTEGLRALANMEWDTYTILPITYTIQAACPPEPFYLAPGTTYPLQLTLATSSAHTLRVISRTGSGTPITNASATLSQGGVPHTLPALTCGQIFFNGLAESDYDLTVEAPGYISYQSISPISVSGHTVVSVTLSPL